MSNQLANKSFHLRWNNHLSNLCTLFEFLYNEQSFVDVTLSCKDGFLRAHKFMLSACSPYFDSILRENPCNHPTVILRGISLREMQLIIEYMYVGSVDIPENELSGLLQVANELHIKGLVQDPVEDEAEKNENKHFGGSYDSEKSDSCLSNERTTPEANKEEYLSEIKEEHTSSSSQNHETSPICGILGIGQVKVEENDTPRVDTPKENFNFEYTDRNTYMNELYCTICNRGFLNKQNMKRHMQTHTGVKPHQCDYCNLSFLRLSHLQRHHRVHTGERPFSCNQCDKDFSRSDKLKQHIAQHHSGVMIPKTPKQRGRPRKVSINVPMALTSQNTQTTGASLPENAKIADKSLEIYKSVSSYQSLQQIYTNISNSMSSSNGINDVSDMNSINDISDMNNPSMPQ